MPHDNHTDSSYHKELEQYGEKALWTMVKDWSDDIPPPTVDKVTLSGGRVIRVVRDDLQQYGTKARAGAAVFHQPEYRNAKTIVYVAPRAGWAPISLAKLCKDTGRRLILFAPAAAKMSHHQTVAWSLGAEMRFIRIAAMPVLNKYAKEFADKHGYTFFPLGLAVPAAVAGIAKVARALDLRNVEQVWCAISTGVLTRGLQLAWPTAIHHCVAVARNVHTGEKGKAIIHSHEMPFLQDAPDHEQPPFPSARNYDAKCWRFIMSEARHNAVFWNVAGEIQPSKTRARKPISERKWNDLSDLEKK